MSYHGGETNSSCIGNYSKKDKIDSSHTATMTQNYLFHIIFCSIMNLFGVLKYKKMGEDFVQNSGLPFTIIRCVMIILLLQAEWGVIHHKTGKKLKSCSTQFSSCTFFSFGFRIVLHLCMTELVDWLMDLTHPMILILWSRPLLGNDVLYFLVRVCDSHFWNYKKKNYHYISHCLPRENTICVIV